MLFIPGVVFTTEHIHKFNMDGLGLEVPSLGVFTLHGGSVECVISDFRHTGVCDFGLCANLFLSNLLELRYALNSIICMSYA
jgi:tetrahydromethanopterin S-methyltransferase subunit C